MKKIKNDFINLILPGCILPILVGIIVGITVFFYKETGEYISSFSKKGYLYLQSHLYFVPIVFISLFLICFIQAFVLKQVPIVKGGGIPTSEGIVRGAIEFNPAITLFLTIILSYLSFFFGLPLGSEGPSVAIGTSIGNLFSKIMPKKEQCYKRYIMTGASATAFSVATGSPITGIIFALEELHRKFSPMIILVSFSSVVAGSTIAYFLSTKFDISYYLFGNIMHNNININSFYNFIPLGILIGLIAVLFNLLIKLFQNILDNRMNKVPLFCKLLISFITTVLIGLFIPEFTGGGHLLIFKLFDSNLNLGVLITLLILKMIMIAWISQSGVTGGMFIPILTNGALVGAIVADIFNIEEYRTVLIAISMASFMAASIGCPLSALVFSFEALSITNNIIPCIISVFFAYITTRILNVTHIYDLVLERKLHSDYSRRYFKVIELSATANPNSFAIGKQARDLLFSANILILQIQRENKDYGKMDNFGEKIIRSNDKITFRVQTYDVLKTKEEIEAFLGVQEEFTYRIIQK